MVKKIIWGSLEKKASAPLARPMTKPIYINLLGLCTFRFGTLRFIIIIIIIIIIIVIIIIIIIIVMIMIITIMIIIIIMIIIVIVIIK